MSVDGGDAQFCQSCGASLSKGATPKIDMQQEAIAPATVGLPLAKIARIAAAGVVFLALLGGVVWFLTKPPAMPEADALTAQFNADVGATEQRVCLNNFPYDKDPVFVNGYDSSTKNWLGLLVGAGIYNPPEIQTSGGWVPQTQYKFTRTQDGIKAIRNSKLCFADGIAIDKLEYSKPKKVKDKFYAEAKYTYRYKNPATWINKPEFKEVDVRHFGQDSFDGRVALVTDGGNWKLMSGQSAPDLGFGSSSVGGRDSGLSSANTHSSSSGSGFLDRVKSFFSSMGGNPLIGKWETKMFGASVRYEFTSDEMRDGASIKKVSYEVRGSEVLVTSSGANVAVIFKVVDRDHISLNTPLGDMDFNRIN